MITRHNPFREILTMHRSIDRLLDRAIDSDQEWQTGSRNLALDVAENEGEYLVKASIPGINPEDLDITFTDNVLTIKGETKEEKDIKEEQYHLRERCFGSFSRSISLPARVKSEAIEASYNA